MTEKTYEGQKPNVTQVDFQTGESKPYDGEPVHEVDLERLREYLHDALGDIRITDAAVRSAQIRRARQVERMGIMPAIPFLAMLKRMSQFGHLEGESKDAYERHLFEFGSMEIGQLAILALRINDDATLREKDSARSMAIYRAFVMMVNRLPWEDESDQK